MTHQHQHRRLSYTLPSPYIGGTDSDEPCPQAHGGIEVKDFCHCGASRSVLQNGRWEEFGKWKEPPPKETADDAVAAARSAGVTSVFQRGDAVEVIKNGKSFFTRHSIIESAAKQDGTLGLVYRGVLHMMMDEPCPFRIG